jgi:threonine dehydrogenase-like Zn-dependent dehydrogenase
MFESLGMPLESGGRVLGHEFCGEVAEVNGDVPGVKVGDRVCAVGMGGNAEYFRVPAALTTVLFPVPAGVSFEEAATTEPLATSLHAVNLSRPVDGETHVIIGAGIIGLGVLQALRALASVRTIVVDLSEKRLAVARQLGADVTIDAGREDAVRRVMELAGSEQLSFMPEPMGAADTVFDCAGLPRGFAGVPALQQAVMMVKAGGCCNSRRASGASPATT